MIKLKEGLYVAARHIVLLEVIGSYEQVLVHLESGERITVDADYKKSKYDKLDELAAAVKAGEL